MEFLVFVKVHFKLAYRVLDASKRKVFGDRKVTGKLLDPLKYWPRQVIVYGGYDRAYAKEKIRKIQSQDLTPSPKNAKYHGKNEVRE